MINSAILESVIGNLLRLLRLLVYVLAFARSRQSGWDTEYRNAISFFLKCSGHRGRLSRKSQSNRLGQLTLTPILACCGTDPRQALLFTDLQDLAFSRF